MCNIFTTNVFAFSLKSLEKFPRAFFLCESSPRSLPLYNTVEIFVFSIMTHLKVALFNALGTYSGVVHLLSCYGTLMLQPSSQVSWEQGKEELFGFFPSLADEALLRSAPGREWLGRIPAHKEFIIWEERGVDSISGDEIWASHRTDHLTSFTF